MSSKKITAPKSLPFRKLIIVAILAKKRKSMRIRIVTICELALDISIVKVSILKQKLNYS
jgi:hypothetical protein